MKFTHNKKMVLDHLLELLDCCYHFNCKIKYVNDVILE